MRLGDNYRLMPSLPGWDGPPDPPRVPVGECPDCGRWVETRNHRVVGHDEEGRLCRGSGLKAAAEDVS